MFTPAKCEEHTENLSWKEEEAGELPEPEKKQPKERELVKKVRGAGKRNEE